MDIPGYTPQRLIDYPYVVVRVACRFCPRHGQYRLARLAAKWGCDLTLDDVLDRIAQTCPYPRPEPFRKIRKYQPFCGILLPDIDRGRPRPPDLPPIGGLRLVVKNDDAA